MEKVQLSLNDLQTLGERVREIRLFLGETQIEFANRIGLEAASDASLAANLSKIETGNPAAQYYLTEDIQDTISFLLEEYKDIIKEEKEELKKATGIDTTKEVLPRTGKAHLFDPQWSLEYPKSNSQRDIFGKIIKDLRRRLNITQWEFAEKLGIGGQKSYKQSTISLMERGEHSKQLTLHLFQKIKELYEIRDTLKFENNPKNKKSVFKNSPGEGKKPLKIKQFSKTQKIAIDAKELLDEVESHKQAQSITIEKPSKGETLQFTLNININFK